MLMRVSTSKMQYALRRHWLITALKSRVTLKRQRRRTAVMMQSLIRGYLTRLLIAGRNNFSILFEFNPRNFLFTQYIIKL
jgi:hypothetical protein